MNSLKKSIGVFVILGLLAVVSLPIRAADNEVEKKMAAALDYYKQGENEAAIKELSHVLMVLHNTRVLKITNVQLCEAVGGYGDYKKNPSNQVKAGDTLWLYFEVEGYGVKKEGDRYLIWLSEDSKVINAEGKVLYERNDIFNYKRSFDGPLLPLFIPNKLANFPPGKYRYQFTVKDQIKQSFVTDMVEFEVVKAEKSEEKEKEGTK